MPRGPSYWPFLTLPAGAPTLSSESPLLALAPTLTRRPASSPRCLKLGDTMPSTVTVTVEQGGAGFAANEDLSVKKVDPEGRCGEEGFHRWRSWERQLSI